MFERVTIIDYDVGKGVDQTFFHDKHGNLKRHVDILEPSDWGDYYD